jgi:hypothetical protein
MKTTLFCLLHFAFFLSPCFAQFRYTLTEVGATGTNAVLSANSQSNYLSAVDVGNTTRIDLLAHFKVLGTNTTSNVVFKLDFGVDGTRYTNEFTWTVAALGTNEAWGITNLLVTNYAWARLNSVTNANPGKLTNYNFYIGKKNGL